MKDSSAAPRNDVMNILDLTPEELKKKFEAAGIQVYRADQVLQWIYEKGVYTFDRMTNLSVDLRQKLKASFVLSLPEVVESQKSSDGQSVKFLLRLSNKDTVESVCMVFKDKKSARTRATVCISLQVGCKFHCAFCASGQDGFFRNLTMGEIISQVLMARETAPA